MLKPKDNGTVVLTLADIQDCLTIEDMAAIMRGKGVPINGYIDPSPHPNYAYTETSDAKARTITITWSKFL